MNDRITSVLLGLLPFFTVDLVNDLSYNMQVQHSYLWWHRVLPYSALLLLNVLLIRHLVLLLRCKTVLLLHTTAPWHVGLLRRDLGGTNVFGRVIWLISLNAILVILCRFWCIQASLLVLARRRARIDNAYLDKVLALRLGYKGLQLWRCESVN